MTNEWTDMRRTVDRCERMLGATVDEQTVGAADCWPVFEIAYGRRLAAAIPTRSPGQYERSVVRAAIARAREAIDALAAAAAMVASSARTDGIKPPPEPAAGDAETSQGDDDAGAGPGPSLENESDLNLVPLSALIPHGLQSRQVNRLNAAKVTSVGALIAADAADLAESARLTKDDVKTIKAAIEGLLAKRGHAVPA